VEGLLREGRVSSRRRPERRPGLKSEHADEIFVVVGLVLFQLRPRVGFVSRVLAGQEYARGDREEFDVVLEDIRLLWIEILARSDA